MRLELTGRHITITPTLRRLVGERLVKLDRLLHDSAVSLQAVLYVEKYMYCVEMTLHVRGEHFLHGAGAGRDWEVALTKALHKINQQALKLKGKWAERKRRAVSPARALAAARPAAVKQPERRPETSARTAGSDVRIVRARRYEVKPMSVDEAAAELGSSGAFLVFRNEATDAVAVLFRRPDGHLGLIEPEA